MSERIVLVTGGRYYGDSAAVQRELDALAPIDTIMHGGCPTGADRLADDYAKARRIARSAYPADWHRFGRSAGPRRNAEMATRLSAYRAAGCDVLVLAFPGGAGTNSMLREARKRGLPIKEIGR